MKRRTRKPALALLFRVTVLSAVVICSTGAGLALPENGVNGTNGRSSWGVDNFVAENMTCGGAQGLKICRLGICVRPVDPAELRRFGLPLQPGLVVTAMRPESPLVSVGVEPRDVLLEVEGEPLDGPQRLSRLMRSAESGRRVFIILAIDHRRGKIGFLQVTLNSDENCEDERP